MLFDEILDLILFDFEKNRIIIKCCLLFFLVGINRLFFVLKMKLDFII
jgi:hypothetical protein